MKSSCLPGEKVNENIKLKGSTLWCLLQAGEDLSVEREISIYWVFQFAQGFKITSNMPRLSKEDQKVRKKTLQSTCVAMLLLSRATTEYTLSIKKE